MLSQLVAAVAEKLCGFDVSSAQVSTLRKMLHIRKSSPGSGTVEAVSLEHLLAAKDLAERLGGIDVARQALASLAMIMES